MRCKQKHRNGKLCKYEADGNLEFCYVHNPKLLPVFFVGNIDGHERNDYEIDLPTQKAQAYINSGHALKMDYAFRVKMEKTVLRLIKKVSKDRLKEVKEYIKAKDKVSLLDFLGESPKNNPDKLQEFINKKGFNEKEKDFLKDFIATNY